MQILRIKIRDSQVARLKEICRLRQLATVETYLLELALADLAAFRLHKIHERFMAPSGPAATASEIPKPNKCRELSPTTVQRILHLRESEKLSGAMLAQRFGCTAATIGRYLRLYDQGVHVQRPVAPSCRSNHDADATGTFYPKVKSRRRKREVQDG